MITREEFKNRLYHHFSFTPTPSQAEAIQQLSEFIYDRGEQFLFIMKGYAGTGKTSLMSALVKSLDELHVRTVLLAPTGRAAKVLSQYTGRKAYTIHKGIYRLAQRDGNHFFIRKENKLQHALFIVDEASMISADANMDGMGMASLLDDLIDFVYSSPHNRMLFIGDDAQLPPVHAVESPALSTDYMKHTYDVTPYTCRLTDVVRQAQESGILASATALREKIDTDDYYPPLFSSRPMPDVTRINGGELEELYNSLYGKYESEEIVTITRSNKRANIFNQEIRNRIHFRENQIATGDFIMAVKNNYYWVDELSEVGFLANGDIMEVMSIHRQQEIYGFHFADVTVRLCDYPDEPNIDIKIILESLGIESASLPYEENQRLYQAIAEDYQEITDSRERHTKIKKDPYLNAVQVKFAYALTCHKTQGGQWKQVIIDKGFVPEDGFDKEFLRWLYTALTRSTEQVWLLNFEDEFFD
ncbi:MAG: AAA family ATPase [Bacteroidales bacterium]|nr:AAA family ATPase [Bacteroidales bacterium]